MINHFKLVYLELKSKVAGFDCNEVELRYKIRNGFFVGRNEVKNFFTISSKTDFEKLPANKFDRKYGESFIYTPLNDHSRKYLKKADYTCLSGLRKPENITNFIS